EKLRMLGIFEWQWIEKRMRTELYRAPYDARQRFPFMQIMVDAYHYDPVPAGAMASLMPAKTPVFAALGDEGWKLWWCKGEYGAAIDAFEAADPRLEMIIIPRDFRWLLTYSHHDELFSVGEPVSTALAALPGGRRVSA
ncbi:MAG: DUF6756 family protein, partial [Pseudomonadota bacterium]